MCAQHAEPDMRRRSHWLAAFGYVAASSMDPEGRGAYAHGRLITRLACYLNGRAGMPRLAPVPHPSGKAIQVSGLPPTGSADAGSRSAGSTEEGPYSVKVVLVDAQHLVLDGLAALLELESDLEVLATASTVDAAAARVAESSPDVVVLDADLAGEDGLRLVTQLARSDQVPRTMVLTALDNPDVLRRALQVGVTSYVLKRGRYGEVAAALRQTAAGEAVISPQFVHRLVPRSPASADVPPAQLTLREQQVLDQISAGATNSRIAQQAGISVRTAQKHVENLFQKLGVHDRASLVAEAFRRDLLR